MRRLQKDTSKMTFTQRIEEGKKQLDQLNKALTEYNLQDGYTSRDVLVFDSVEDIAIKYKDSKIEDIYDAKELTEYIQTNHKHYVVYSEKENIFVGVKKLKH